MRHFIAIVAAALLAAAACAEDAKDAADHREEGVKALRESQTNQKMIVTAAKHFAKAAAIYEKVGENDAAVEANSFLYWCKKKMTLADIEAFAKAGEVEVSRQLVALDEIKVEKTDAQTWFDRAEKFAAANPDEHLLIAIRFFEVADRFKGTDVSLTAQDRSLKEMQSATAATAKPEPAQPSPARPVAAAKAAVPELAKLKDAEKAIKEIFKDEYAKRGVDDKRALGAKLLQQGNETKDDLTSRYVLLKEAVTNATAGSDAETVLKALDALGQSFEVDAAALKAEALGKIVPATPDAAKSLARMYLKVIDEAVAAESYDVAVKLCIGAEAAARKAQDVPLATQVTARGKEVRSLHADHVKIKAAQAILKDKPDDPEANLAVGVYLCFIQNNWQQGAQLLAKSSDQKLKALADLEAAGAADVEGQLALGDAWFDFAAGQIGGSKTWAQQRAEFHYTALMPKLAGIQQARIEKRLMSLPERPGQLVVWNTHNARYNNYGANEFDVTLFAGSTEVWSKKRIGIDWKQNEDLSATVDLPVIRFSRVRIDARTTLKVEGVGLNEIEIWQGGKNIALGCKATTDSYYGKDSRFAPGKVTDGIIMSNVHGKGYWTSHKTLNAWVEIDLMQKSN